MISKDTFVFAAMGYGVRGLDLPEEAGGGTTRAKELRVKMNVLLLEM